MAPRKAVQVENLWAGLLNNDSEPLTGGKVYTYETGTTTPKAVYLDRAKTTPATNPVVLDTYGRAEVYGDGLYRFVVKDSADVTLYTIDDLEYIPLEGGTLDDIDIGQTTPGKGKFTNLEFTTNLTDANGNIFTALGEKVEFQQQTIDAGVAAKDPVYYDTTSSSWKKADLAGNDPEGVYIGNNTVVNRGSTGGFTGLTANIKYYLDTSGGLTTSETVWFIGRSISTTQMIVHLEKRSMTTSSSGDVLSILENSADIEKYTRGKCMLGLDNYIIESFSVTQNIDIALDTSYTGGTTLILDYKIELQDGNYLPLLIYDSLGAYEIVWLTSLASGSTGAWTYNIAAALSQNYTTDNSAKVTNCTGLIDNSIMNYYPGAAGARAKAAKLIRAFYTKEANLLKTFLGSLDFYADNFEVDLTNYGASKTMDLQTTTDRSGEFKDNDYIILFGKMVNETPADGVNIYAPSIMNTFNTAAISWYMFQMNGNSSYSTPDLTVTVDKVLDPITGTFGTSLPALGATLTNYKVIRVPAALAVLFGAKTSTTLTDLYPVNFIIKNNELAYPSGVHSYWKMDETSGGVANSRAGSSFALTQNGTVPAAAGKLGGARGPFTDVNYFSWNAGGSSATVYDTTTFVWEFWFKTSASGSNYYIFNKGNNSSAGYGCFVDTDGNLVWGYNSATTYLTSTLNGYNNNVWHQGVIAMMATSGANNARMYIDGALSVATTGVAFTPATNDLRIGRANAPAVFFNGLLDNIAFWSTVPASIAILEARIAESYYLGLGRIYGYGNGYSLKYKKENISSINKGIMVATLADQATGVNSSLLKMTGALI